MNDDWIHEIKMDQIPQNQKGNVKQWTAEEFKFYWERIITDIQGDRIYLENPIVQGLDPKYGTAHLMLCSCSFRINRRTTRNSSIPDINFKIHG
jgi:hypothetical protein